MRFTGRVGDVDTAASGLLNPKTNFLLAESDEICNARSLIVHRTANSLSIRADKTKEDKKRKDCLMAVSFSFIIQ